MPLIEEQARSLFLAALERAPGQWDSYLRETCADSPELEARVQQLLREHEALGSIQVGRETGLGTTVEQTVAAGCGTTIGPYLLLERIGEGGMGEVWMAQQSAPIRRLVAVKLIKAGMDSKSVLARFEQERQALALMDHPNIAKVLDAGTVGLVNGDLRLVNESLTGSSQSPITNHPSPMAGRPYFVMELVKGIPITKYCDEQRLTPRQRLELFLPVCQAIQHAHQKGIIHRDVKPSNVLVALYDDKPVPKVIDFGVAKATGQSLTERTLHTGFGSVVGTFEYMSPEQASFNQLDVDTRSDVYSLGVLLYELLAGSPPFSRKELEKAGMQEMFRLIREQEPSKPSTKLSSSDALPSLSANRGTEPAKLTRLVRGELDWIVMKALEKDRKHRYETANGFAMDVQRYLADEAVLACPPSSWYRLRKFARRNRGPVLAGSVVLGCLVAGIIGTSAALVWAVRERDAKANALDAETNARAAEQQARDQAMAALRDMTDDIVENQMSRATHLTDENKEFLRKIIRHFEGFAALTADDADSRSIRAEGYGRVGRMRKHLGEFKEAEQAYDVALALRKQLVADFPDRQEFHQNLAISYSNLGNLLNDTGRLKEAETAHADAVAIQIQQVADFPNRPEFRRLLAKSYNNLGIPLRATGRHREAITLQGKALSMRQQLIIDLPGRPEILQELAQSHNSLGFLFKETGRFQEAAKAFNDALAIQKQLVVDFPKRPEFRQELAFSIDHLGGLHFSARQLEKAATLWTDVVVIRKELAADFPTRPEFRHQLAMGRTNLATLFRDTGRREDAEAIFLEALAALKQLAAELPTWTAIHQDLATCHNNLGVLFEVTGHVEKAVAAYTDALATRKRLAAEFPNQPTLRNDVAGAYVNLANLCNQSREFGAAKAYLEEALPHHQAALDANSRNQSYRQYFRSHLFVRVHASAGLRDQSAAVQDAERLRDLGWDPPQHAYDAACALTLCILFSKQDAQLEDSQRAAAMQFYGDQALAMLRIAVAKGYKNVAEMKKDSDLNALRGRDEFKKLLAELEAK